MDRKSKEAEGQSPDGGYGWVIVIGALLQICLIIQILPLFGVLFGVKFEEFEASQTEKSSVISAFLLSGQFPILFVGPMVEIASERVVAIIASTFMGIGLLISAFSTSIAHLIIGVGVFCGFGIGISATNNITIINKYFTKKVGIALGLVASCMEIVGLLVPQLMKVLIPNFSSQNVILIYFGMTFVTSTVGALLYKPLPKYQPIQSKDDENSIRDKREKPSIKNIFKMIEWSLLKDPYCMLIMGINSTIMTSMFIATSEIALIAKARHFSLEEQADLITILSTSGIFMKFAQGMLMDSSMLKRIFAHPMKMLYIFSALCMALSIMGLALADSFIELSIIIVVFSFFSANIMLNYSQILR